MGEGERDREATEKTLLDAVGSVVREEGFSRLGINKVARRAGVSKVLIYRYFGDLDGLIRRWLLKNNFWAGNSTGTEKQILALSGRKNSGAILHGMMMDLFRGQVSQLRSTPEVREMLRWFLCEENPVAATVMNEVEDRGTSLTRTFIQALGKGQKVSGQADSEAVIALLVSGIYNLALYSDRTNRFNGVALDTDEGWERILRAVETISKSLIESYEVRKISGDETE